MAKSALLKSSLAKKYWMALTGLFLCLFLVGHLIGNLQLIFADALAFNLYALFMTTNPAVKILSYVTYISILFHAIDGIILTVQNQKARPVKYVMNNPGKNTIWASRNMAVLGTIILVFIITHMVNFWAVMHFKKDMPLQTKVVPYNGNLMECYVTTGTGISRFIPVQAIDGVNYKKEGNKFYQVTPKDASSTDVKGSEKSTEEVYFAEGYKDLHKITVDFFKDPKYGLIATILYVIAMITLGFHLFHGFGSAFQSLGANNPKYNGAIKNFGKAFSIIVPLLFAIIPLYIHFLHK
ncbi:succinate dehydrogenase cytochrome b subunit [Flavobacterium subsaxonicum]|uniref:Succinate dehydrogenase n=1 Tax=Flavobacterium subsaxonicum WB 4.1-42 = DSM 21790 TaxID=1121898 RepID=A0A0A2MHN9_9FLAO|nr:succinate dehydrogenase cytochrome b subunit [Flavobacterium subsaxonicum]KGO91809.1 succinate dehydrogenase [Flavobacterium subsaxonicum WB 4.1-42 = DSM 21790]